jgi:transcriptional regulator with XRE-family HTH domain
MPRPPKNKPTPLDLGIPPLGPRLARIRKLRGFTQYSLADHIGVSRKQIADYEQGIAHPNDEMVIRLAIALKISSDTLLGLNEVELPEESTNTRFTRRLKDLEKLPEQKKRAIVKILDEFVRPEGQ